MVYLIDDESVFDAPLDKIWRYLSSEGHKHPSFKNVQREVNANTVTITSERSLMGKPVKMKVKLTLYPPFGYVTEHLEGPTAGSRSFQYYTPNGDKTGVTVVGDFKITGLDEKATKDAILGQMQITFDEDNANLKEMR